MTSFSYLANALEYMTIYEELLEDNPAKYPSYPIGLNMHTAERMLAFAQDYHIEPEIVDLCNQFLEASKLSEIDITQYEIDGDNYGQEEIA